MLQQYSIFFGDMSSQGHELTYISSDSQDFGLKTYGILSRFTILFIYSLE